MNNSKLVSIIIPVYNIEKYVQKCIESVIEQTYKNIEILVIDDGSIDNSSTICKDMAKKDSRIKVYNKINGGLSDARNYGIKKAKGEYLFFIDGDDYIANDCIEVLLKSLIKEKSDIATTQFIRFYEKDKPISVEGHYKTYDTSEALEMLMYQNNCTTSAWGKIYKKELFNQIKYPKGKICEDLPTTYKLFAASKRITIGTHKKYFYLQRENSIIRSKFNSKRAEALSFAREETQFIKENFPSITAAAINREFIEAITIIIAIGKTNKYQSIRDEAIKIAKKYRNTVLFDRKSTRKTKVYALMSYLGPNNLLRIISLKNKLV